MALNDRTTFTRGRRLAIGLNVAVASALALVAALLVLYLAFRPELRRRLDLTSRGTFSLSDSTLKILGGLEQPIDVWTCFAPTDINESGNLSPGLSAVLGLIGTHCNDLVREFEVRSNGKVRLHALDPGSLGHLGRLEDLSIRIGERAVNRVVVMRGPLDKPDRWRVVGTHDLAEFDEGTTTSQQLQRATLQGFRDEEALAKAILSVTEARAQRVALLRGHDERDAERYGLSATGARSVTRFRVTLQAQNLEVVALDLSGTPAISKEQVDLLAILEPRKEIPPPEIEAIVRYARSGGRVLVALGPDSTNSLDFPLLDQVYGVARTPNPVCVEARIGEVKQAPDAFFVDDWSPTAAIVRPLRAAKSRLHVTRSSPLRAIGRAEQSDVVVEPLFWMRDPLAWVDLPDAAGRRNGLYDPASESEEKGGPFSLAVAVTRKSDGGRAVVLGGAGWLDDDSMQLGPANHDLALDAVNWLVDREQLISIAPKPFDSITVDLTPQESRTILLYVVVAIPGLALLVGVAVFWARRT